MSLVRYHQYCYPKVKQRMTDPELEQLIHKEFNTTRGRLAGMLESFGLNDKQERACITTMKSLSYDAEKRILDAIRQRYGG